MAVPSPLVGVFVPRREDAAFVSIRNGHYDSGLLKCLELAKAGDTDAKSLAGWMLFNGVGGQKLVDDAEQLLIEAREEGSAYGTYGLAWVSLSRGLPSRCYSLMKESADAGFVPAILDQGRLLAGGIGTKKDLSRAEKCFVSAVRLGHRMAPPCLLELWSYGQSGLLKWAAAQLLKYPVAILCTFACLGARHEERGLFFNMPKLS